MGTASRRCGLAAVALTLITISASPSLAALRHRYTFNNPAGPAIDGVSIIEDRIGDGDGVVRGAGGMFTGSQMVFPGGTQSAGGAYVDLPNGMISAIHTDATFEAWYTINSTADDWTRIWDFGSSGGMEFTGPGAVNGAAGDTFYYAALRGTNINTQRATIENDEMASLSGIPGVVAGGSITSDPNVPTFVGVRQHVAVTFDKDSGGGLPRMTVYINGTQVDQDTGTVATPFQLENLNDVNNWLGRSNYNADNMFNGSINEFRIYDHLRTSTEILQCELFGCPVNDLVILEVNTVTGAVVMKKNDDLPAIDYYKISSAGGALNPAGWTSFDDTESGDPVGAGWDESGGTDEGEVGEFFLSVAGDTSFVANNERSLGNLFNPSTFGVGNNGDLVFEYGMPSGGPAIVGIVAYVTSPDLPGDYNGDGAINAADYTVYRNRQAGIGGTTLPNDAGEPGVTIDDYNYWKAHYGETAGSGSAINGGNVPEPGSLAIFAIATAAFGLRRRQRCPV